MESNIIFDLSHFSVMQMNAGPVLVAVDSTLHRENWQQRRHNFLSKHSVFGGELKQTTGEPDHTDQSDIQLEQRYERVISEYKFSQSKIYFHLTF